MNVCLLIENTNKYVSAHKLDIPPHRTAAFRGSFKFAATKCWNDLPPPLRLKTIRSFKQKIKRAGC